MRADLAERLIEHPGELGVGPEEIVRRSLRAYIPTRFDVSVGIVFDSKGNASEQLDTVIANGSQPTAIPLNCIEVGRRAKPAKSIDSTTCRNASRISTNGTS